VKSEALKLAEIEERKGRERMLFDLVTHPVVMAVAGFYLSDRLQGAYVQDPTSFQPGSHVLTTEKEWDPTAGKLNTGAAFAMQTGLVAYLGAEAVKSIAGAVR
jgi:hypothetical protein